MPPSCTHEDVYQNFPLIKIHLSNRGWWLNYFIKVSALDCQKYGIQKNKSDCVGGGEGSRISVLESKRDSNALAKLWVFRL